MPNLAWEQTQFRGIHTQPAKTAEGHLFAEDMENLRIDGDGWLQLRSPITTLPWLPDGEGISPACRDDTHTRFHVLREDGRLYVEALRLIR